MGRLFDEQVDFRNNLDFSYGSNFSTKRFRIIRSCTEEKHQNLRERESEQTDPSTDHPGEETGCIVGGRDDGSVTERTGQCDGRLPKPHRGLDNCNDGNGKSKI